jgi:hypothetical protein
VSIIKLLNYKTKKPASHPVPRALTVTWADQQKTTKDLRAPHHVKRMEGRVRHTYNNQGKNQLRASQLTSQKIQTHPLKLYTHMRTCSISINVIPNDVAVKTLHTLYNIRRVNRIDLINFCPLLNQTARINLAERETGLINNPVSRSCSISINDILYNIRRV